jgi:hypothetical protein
MILQRELIFVLFHGAGSLRIFAGGLFGMFVGFFGMTLGGLGMVGSFLMIPFRCTLGSVAMICRNNHTPAKFEFC